MEELCYFLVNDKIRNKKMQLDLYLPFSEPVVNGL